MLCKNATEWKCHSQNTGVVVNQAIFRQCCHTNADLPAAIPLSGQHAVRKAHSPLTCEKADSLVFAHLPADVFDHRASSLWKKIRHMHKEAKIGSDT